MVNFRLINGLDLVRNQHKGKLELLRTWGLFRLIILIKLRSCEIDNFCHCRVRDESYLFSSVHPAMHYVVNNTLKLFVQFSWTMVDAFPRSIGQPAVYHPFFIAHDHHILLWETLNSSTKCSLCHLMWACVRIGKALIPRETHPFCLRFSQNQMFYLAPGLTVVTAGCSLIRKLRQGLRRMTISGVHFLMCLLYPHVAWADLWHPGSGWWQREMNTVAPVFSLARWHQSWPLIGQ